MSVADVGRGGEGRSEHVYRRHSWIVRTMAIVVAILIVTPALGSRSPESSVVLVWLAVAFGLVPPVGLIIWDRLRGIHVMPYGIKNVPAGRSVTVSWQDIAYLEIDHYGLPFAIYACLHNGTRVPLTAVLAWSWQKKSIEGICSELKEDLEAHQAGTPNLFSG